MDVATLKNIYNDICETQLIRDKEVNQWTMMELQIHLNRLPKLRLGNISMMRNLIISLSRGSDDDFQTFLNMLRNSRDAHCILLSNGLSIVKYFGVKDLVKIIWDKETKLYKVAPVGSSMDLITSIDWSAEI